ncbi:MAG: metallophosphoesterase [Thermoleophilia bacterium]|nr:metallophosphoesterase [Thermoleophilia bacterium]
MRPGRALAAALGAGLGWGLYESQWVELRRLELELPGLPGPLDGLTILHLSDFHLGTPSLGRRAVAKALAWGAAREPDLVAITGDLVSGPGGERVLVDGLRALGPRHGAYAVLGNHDVAVTRDPFSAGFELADLAAAGAVLLRDEAVTVEVAGARIQLVGVEPLAYAAGRSRPSDLADPGADLRILLCHFPEIVEGLPPGSFQLVLAGHLHGGQICLPYPGGKVRLAHLASRYPEGVFRVGGTTLVVSRGLGTTFVPLRFCARPEAAELVLRGARA